MAILDLRSETPPFGYHAEQVPLLDISTFEIEANRLMEPVDGTLFDVFWLPDYPSFILRQQDLYEEPGCNPLRSTEDLRSYVDHGNRHFQLLEDMGIYIPSHRHIEALLPVGSANKGGEGRMLSIAERLSPDFEVMDPTNEAHLPGCFTTLKALHAYAKTRLAEGSDILVDTYDEGQYSYNTVTGAVALHDTDIELCNISELMSVGYCRFGVSMHDFYLFADKAAQTARGTAYEAPLTALRQRIASDLPEPLDESQESPRE